MLSSGKGGMNGIQIKIKSLFLQEIAWLYKNRDLNN